MILVAVFNKTVIDEVDVKWLTGQDQLNQYLASSHYDVYAVEDEAVKQAFVSHGYSGFKRAVFYWLTEGWSDEKLSWQRRADGVIYRSKSKPEPLRMSKPNFD